MTRTLAREIETFNAEFERLVAVERGRWVAIVGTEIVGVYDDAEAAFDAGRARVGAKPFLVRRVVERRAAVVASQWVTLSDG